uniref:Uncharacterized protein n=1 Tax=Setaria italica TaxID=4555 RepID=K3YNJ3_SETIT
MRSTACYLQCRGHRDGPLDARTKQNTGNLRRAQTPLEHLRRDCLLRFFSF